MGLGFGAEPQPFFERLVIAFYQEEAAVKAKQREWFPRSFLDSQPLEILNRLYVVCLFLGGPDKASASLNQLLVLTLALALPVASINSMGADVGGGWSE